MDKVVDIVDIVDKVDTVDIIESVHAVVIFLDIFIKTTLKSH